MYDEDSYKSQIFWLKFKRIFMIILFTIIGCGIGIIVSTYLIDVLEFNNNLRALLVGLPTLIFFAIGLLSTSNIAKEVQDSYWRIAVLRKLTVISKKLDNLNSLDNLSNATSTPKVKKVKKVVKKSSLDIKPDYVQDNINTDVN